MGSIMDHLQIYELILLILLILKVYSSNCSGFCTTKLSKFQISESMYAEYFVPLFTIENVSSEMFCVSNYQNKRMNNTPTNAFHYNDSLHCIIGYFNRDNINITTDNNGPILWTIPSNDQSKMIVTTSTNGIAGSERTKIIKIVNSNKLEVVDGNTLIKPEDYEATDGNPIFGIRNGKLYACNGFVGSVSFQGCFMYEPWTKMWIKKKPSIKKSQFAGFTTSDGALIMAGGSSQQLQAKYWINNKWTDLPDLPIKIKLSCVISLPNSDFFLIGGYLIDSNVPTKNCYKVKRHNATSWETAGNLNSERHSHTCASLSDGRILVTGGITTSGAKDNSMEIYNHHNDSFTKLSNNYPGTGGLGLRVHSFTHNNEFWVVGVGGETDKIYKFDETNEIWKEVGDNMNKHIGAVQAVPTRLFVDSCSP